MIIYKATFPNNKCYIGQTTKEFHIRKNRHKNDAKSGSNYKFHRAIRKYGWNNLKWLILENNINNVSKLDEKEIFYIKKFDTIKNGYNTIIGKNVSGKNNPFYGKKHTIKSINKIKDARKKQVITPEHKRKISKGNMGHIVSVETRKKLVKKIWVVVIEYMII